VIRPTTPAVVLILGLSASLSGWSCSQASEAERRADAATPGRDAGVGGARSRGLDLVLAGSSSAGQEGSSVCAAQVREGQRVPVDMYFLVDSSGSMAEQVTGGSKWNVVSAALVTFLNDPRNTGTGVGVGYFPSVAQSSCVPGQSGCLCVPIINLCFSTEGGSCAASDYAKPAVPVALPSPVAAVVSDLASHQIGGGTPTAPALDGALQYLSEWANQHPERKPLLVLATDGEPSGCADNAPQDVADVAARALAGPHAIQTFVIGVGSSLISLDLVAQAGGTDRAFLVDTGGDVGEEFADALDQIRGAASSCDFSIPSEGSAGEAIDPLKVNVSYTARGSNSATLVPQTFMGDPSNCDSSGGWYYDDSTAPTAIRLCDATCRSLSGGAIQLEFGCDTVVQPPR
jgi:Mg-chelatase subunit ChlD